jgi:hypothetical protein
MVRKEASSCRIARNNEYLLCDCFTPNLPLMQKKAEAPTLQGLGFADVNLSASDIAVVSSW